MKILALNTRRNMVFDGCYGFCMYIAFFFGNTLHSLVPDHCDDSNGRKAEITQPLAVAQNLLLPQEMVGLDCCLLPVS